MSTLVLVRHGQAKPFEKNSDCLSETGEQQAVRLGAYWREHNIRFDEVYTGTMLRHTRTAELAGFDKFEQRAEFNEYNADGILRAHPEFVPATDNRQLQRAFEAAMPLWIAGTLEAPGLETWREFHGRVTRGLQAIAGAESARRRVVVFTSGGPIGIAVQTVLQAPEAMAIEVNWRIRNCSLTEFLFKRDRISLEAFNATPHLKEVTFR